MVKVTRLGLAAIAAMAMTVGVYACDDATDDGGGEGEGGTGGGGTGGIGGIGGQADCPEGERPDAAEQCRTVCAGMAECYPNDAYCASDDLCYGAAADPGQDCARAALAPAKEADGPLLYAPAQVDLDGASDLFCTKDPNTCTNNGNVCSFSVAIYDPDDDLPATNNDLYANVLFVRDDGTGVATFDVPRLAGGVLEVSLCFGEDEVAPAGALQVLDLAGHHSNASCLAGVAP